MANILPNRDIFFPGTTKLLAKLFFRSVVTVDLKESYSCGVLPISFLYLDHLYWIKGNPFIFNNELKEFQPAGVHILEVSAYKQLYKEILELGDVIKPTPIRPDQSSNHMIDALGYSLLGLKFDFSKPEIETEKKIIDQLDLPALENSLNEAVRIENYEAAAHIRNKIEGKDYIIFEDSGRLKIRRRNPLAGDFKGKDYENLYFPSD